MKIIAAFASKESPNQIVFIDREFNFYSGTNYGNYIVARMWIHDGSLSRLEQRIDITLSFSQQPSTTQETFLT